MHSTNQKKEWADEVSRICSEWTNFNGGTVAESQWLAKKLHGLFAFRSESLNPFDFVEPCEPDCTPERHAYHQGQWDMAGRIKEAQEIIRNQE